jgi:predicted nucleic acid-binding protein
MEKVLLDTDILSEYLKGHDRNVTRRAADYARIYGVFTFTSVTVHEIVFGLEVKNATVQLQKVLAWLDQNEQMTPDARDYLDAAKIKAQARKQGFIVELADCLIAAVAVRLDVPLVTGNTEDFQALQSTGAGLRIENWRSPL